MCVGGGRDENECIMACFFQVSVFVCSVYGCVVCTCSVWCMHLCACGREGVGGAWEQGWQLEGDVYCFSSSTCIVVKPQGNHVHLKLGLRASI